MASRQARRMRWAIIVVALAVFAAACTNDDSGGPSAERARPTAKSRVPSNDSADPSGEETVDSTADPAPATTVAPSTRTTSTGSGQTVSGRQLLQASRARFTRPLPTVAPTTTTVVTPPVDDPTGTEPGPSDPTGPKDPPGVKEMRPSQELIAAAFEKGEITYAQYLLYRAYALFWDPRLPAAYDGIGSAGEDDFFTEARLRFNQLDADTQAKLAPFLERPASPTGYGCPLTDNGQPVTWIDSGAASTHFKVWACATNGAADDIAKVVASLDEVSPDMTAAMGAPVPDTGTAEAGGDTRIDVYLLDTIATRERGGKQQAIDGTTIAASVADDPFAGQTASSYLVFGRPRLGERTGMRRAVVHQFFHSLQYAHNYAIKTVVPEATPWFFEASAAWAEWAFLPFTSDITHADYFTAGFRTDTFLPLEIPSALAGLTSSERAHPWWAYIWPFFMQQQAGGDPAAVFDTWDAVEGATDWNAFHGAVDAQLPFATSFRDFSVRNLNLDLGPASEPRYHDLDAQFPDGIAPTLSSDFEITQPGTLPLELGGPGGSGLLALATQYDRVEVGPQSNTRTLALDFTDVPKGVDVTVLTKAPDGTWTRHDVTPGGRLDFDFTAPGGAVEEFFVILANHEREPNWDKPGGVLLGGTYRITAS